MCPTLSIPQTAAHQAPLSMGFSRQEYWIGLPFPSPGDLPNPGIEHRSSAMQADALPTELCTKPSKCKSPLIKNDPGEDYGWLLISQTEPSLHYVLTLETHIPPVDYFCAKTKSKADQALEEIQEFPGDPVVRTRCFHCQGPGSIRELRTHSLAVLLRKKKKKIQQT